jgi:hypothetical protein
MVWPQIPETRYGCAGAARRYSRPWVAGRGTRDGTDSQPPRGVQIGIIQVFLNNNDGITLWAVPYEKSSHIGFGDTLPHPLCDHTITRCFLPMPRFAIARPASPRLASPHHTTPQRCLFSLTSGAAAGHAGVQKRKFIPFGKIWVELRLVSRKPHGGPFTGAPGTPSLHLHSRSPCPGACDHLLQHRLLQHTP